MKKIYFAILLTLITITTASSKELKLAYGKYKIDSDHTRVSFIISHFVVSQVEGRFNDVKGSFTLNEKMSNNTLDVTVPITSIDTGVAKRDEHLRSPEFFDVAKYPDMTFKSTKFSGSLKNLKVTGDLTIKDVTKKVTLDGKYMGSVKDSWGGIRAAFKATGKINRKDFNINYNDMVEMGPAVGDEVTINIITEGILEK